MPRILDRLQGSKPLPSGPKSVGLLSVKHKFSSNPRDFPDAALLGSLTGSFHKRNHVRAYAMSFPKKGSRPTFVNPAKHIILIVTPVLAKGRDRHPKVSRGSRFAIETIRKNSLLSWSGVLENRHDLNIHFSDIHVIGTGVLSSGPAQVPESQSKPGVVHPGSVVLIKMEDNLLPGNFNAPIIPKTCPPFFQDPQKMVPSTSLRAI